MINKIKKTIEKFTQGLTTKCQNTFNSDERALAEFQEKTDRKLAQFLLSRASNRYLRSEGSLTAEISEILAAPECDDYIIAHRAKKRGQSERRAVLDILKLFSDAKKNFLLIPELQTLSDNFFLHERSSEIQLPKDQLEWWNYVSNVNVEADFDSIFEQFVKYLNANYREEIVRGFEQKDLLPVWEDLGKKQAAQLSLYAMFHGFSDCIFERVDHEKCSNTDLVSKFAIECNIEEDEAISIVLGIMKIRFYKNIRHEAKERKAERRAERKARKSLKEKTQ